MLASSPHRPAWAVQTPNRLPPTTTYLQGAPTYLGRPTMGSFPICPPYTSAYLASAPSAFIIPPYPTHCSYEPTVYTNSSSGSSRAASSEPPSPAGKVCRPKAPPKTFEITIPKTNRSIEAMFVERVAHVTAPVQYGIVPVNPDESGELKTWYNMSVLNSTPTDKVAFRSFYIDDKWTKEGPESILGQLLSLGIVEPVRRVHYEPRSKSCLVKVLLKEEEVRPLSPRDPSRGLTVAMVGLDCTRVSESYSQGRCVRVSGEDAVWRPYTCLEVYPSLTSLSFP
jgi:hypothetical protein